MAKRNAKPRSINESQIYQKVCRREVLEKGKTMTLVFPVEEGVAEVIDSYRIPLVRNVRFRVVSRETWQKGRALLSGRGGDVEDASGQRFRDERG